MVKDFWPNVGMVVLLTACRVSEEDGGCRFTAGVGGEH